MNERRVLEVMKHPHATGMDINQIHGKGRSIASIVKVDHRVYLNRRRIPGAMEDTFATGRGK